MPRHVDVTSACARGGVCSVFRSTLSGLAGGVCCWRSARSPSGCWRAACSFSGCWRAACSSSECLCALRGGSCVAVEEEAEKVCAESECVGGREGVEVDVDVEDEEEGGMVHLCVYAGLCCLTLRQNTQTANRWVSSSAALNPGLSKSFSCLRV